MTHKPNCMECAKWAEQQHNAKESARAIAAGREIIKRLAQQEIAKRSCENCKHTDKEVYEAPCISCRDELLYWEKP